MSTIVSSEYSLQDVSAPAAPLPVTTIAVVGAGRVGTALARGFTLAGYDVRVAGAGAATDIALMVDVMAPGATAHSVADAVAGADVVIMAIPLHRLHAFDASVLEGKVVVDVMNYWEPIDGTLAAFENPTAGTSGVVAQHLSGARVVKAFNHIGYHEMESDRADAGSDNRRALAVASDHPAEAATVMTLVESLGFDALYAGPLERGVALEAGGEIFGRRLTLTQLATALTQP